MDETTALVPILQRSGAAEQLQLGVTQKNEGAMSRIRKFCGGGEWIEESDAKKS